MSKLHFYLHVNNILGLIPLKTEVSLLWEGKSYKKWDGSFKKKIFIIKVELINLSIISIYNNWNRVIDNTVCCKTADLWPWKAAFIKHDFRL